jgi:hypothetical protein
MNFDHRQLEFKAAQMTPIGAPFVDTRAIAIADPLIIRAG